MKDSEITAAALKEGFADAAVIGTDKIVFDPEFRKYCEENLCGRYGINHSCPPECGTPSEMKNRVLAGSKALVLRTVSTVSDIADKKAMLNAKNRHNAFTLKLTETLKTEGHRGFTIGSSCCMLCPQCTSPCPFPDKKYSCMSAYCINVRDLALKCGMSYDIKPNELPLFSMFVFD